MAMGTTRFKFLAIAMVFHLVYIYSIFDIYFVSPIVTGMPLVSIERPPGTKAPADRLVLFVGMTVADEARKRTC
jgi:phosphatidylinositol glycan class N